MSINQLSTFTSSARNVSLAIIGAGPAGLACGIKALQLNPKQSVVILEKSERVGGLCHTAKVGNFKFEVGCNQPPIGFERTLKNLDVTHGFISRSNECVFENGSILRSPFDFGTMLYFLSHPVDSARLFWRTLYNEKSTPLSSMLSGFNSIFANKVYASSTYSAFASDINLELLRTMMAQGVQHPRIPIGGMASVTDKMREKFIQLGGQIDFRSDCSGISKLPNGSQLIKTRDGKRYKSDFVVSSVDVSARKYYPPQAKPGLAMTTLLFAVKSVCKYPHGIHTMAFLPNDFMKVTCQIREGGYFPETPSFHCFLNSLSEQNDCYTVTAYVPTPRGLDALTDEQADRIQRHVIAKIESRMYGFRTSVVEKHIISPAEYMKRFGMINNIPFLELPAGVEVPRYIEEIDTHFIGSSVNSSNVLTAVDSGIKTAKNVLELSNSTHQI